MDGIRTVALEMRKIASLEQSGTSALMIRWTRLTGNALAPGVLIAFPLLCAGTAGTVVAMVSRSG